MLNENIKHFRKAKGLSQEELSVRLNVVRQTVSKWERGLSVPDAEMLISVSEVFGTTVGTLLGETVTEPTANDMQAICEKLEVINLQLARAKETRRRAFHVTFLLLGSAVVLVAGLLFLLGSPYLSWDFSNPETAVIGTAMHAFEFVFVRVAPFVLIGAIAGIVLTRKNNHARDTKTE